MAQIEQLAKQAVVDSDRRLSATLKDATSEIDASSVRSTMAHMVDSDEDVRDVGTSQPATAPTTHIQTHVMQCHCCGTSSNTVCPLSKPGQLEYIGWTHHDKDGNPSGHMSHTQSCFPEHHILHTDTSHHVARHECNTRIVLCSKVRDLQERHQPGVLDGRWW
jgi:hypothetical protein